MRQSYNLDALIDYGTSEIPETTRVVNPAHRRLDGQVRKKAALLKRDAAQFGALNLKDDIEPKKVEAFAQRKSELQDAIAELQREVDDLKAQRKAPQRHVTYGQLPADARLERLSTQSEHLIDVIKMVAYRAETAMVRIVREKMTRHDDARSLLRAIYQTEADIVPDQQVRTLTVCLHPLANASSDEAVRNLCDEINATGTLFWEPTPALSTNWCRLKFWDRRGEIRMPEIIHKAQCHNLVNIRNRVTEGLRGIDEHPEQSRRGV